MLTRRLYIKDSPELSSLGGYKLFSKVVENSKLRRKKPDNFIPVKYLYIVTDGHDLLSFKQESGEDSIFLMTSPEHRSLFSPNVDFVLSKTKDSGIDKLKDYFEIESYGNDDCLQVVDNNQATKLLDGVLITKTIFVDHESLVNMIPKKEMEVSSINLSEALYSLEYVTDEFNFDDLSKHILYNIFLGRIRVPERISEGFEEEE